ncbi:hypothetical protein HELRODRAFT_143868, partial [Helobdella robusta]|uniref:LRRCT domain-containing protein n=1 Tax=Helobdella robusta TaxID=6412 RepID=T1EJC7_HELRO
PRNVVNPYEPPYKLNFAGSSISNVEYKDYFGNVAWLNLTNNNIESISPTALPAILNIPKVYLQSNKLTTLPVLPQNCINRLTSIEEIEITNNLLERLDDGTFDDYFGNVAWLNLTNNNIENISLTALPAILNIPKVYLQSNKLTTLPFYFGIITTTELTLDNNPWDCSCGKVWFKHWLKSLKDR